LSFFSALQAVLCIGAVLVAVVAALVVRSALQDCAADAEGQA